MIVYRLARDHSWSSCLKDGRVYDHLPGLGQLLGIGAAIDGRTLKVVGGSIAVC